MSIKRKITIALFAFIAAICFAMPFAANVKTSYADANFAMINGASVRLGDKDGIRFVAKVDDAEKDYHMLIVPYDWVSDCSVGADYYAVANQKATETNSTLADMQCEAVEAGENNGFGLAATDYCVKGSLTGIKYDNINAKWFGIAYYMQDGTRTYASFTENENVRSIVKVASGCLNKYEYETADETKLLTYVSKGIAKANGTAEAEYEYSKPTFTLNKTTIEGAYKDDDQTISVNGIPSGVDIDVKWQSSDASSVSVDDNGKISFVGVNYTYYAEAYSSAGYIANQYNGCKPGEKKPATITAKVCGETVSASVTSKTARASSTMATDLIVGTSKTYGGKQATGNTLQMSVIENILTNAKNAKYNIDSSKIEFCWANGAGVNASGKTRTTITAEGVLTGGELNDNAKSGVACVAWRLLDDDGEALVWDQVNVKVATSISSKFDMDMLALAYARGKVSDWAEGNYYLLTNDIDYNNAVYIPIAAYANQNLGGNIDTNGDGTPDITLTADQVAESRSNFIGLQWKTILGEDNEYGITYDEFKTKGLNQNNWNTAHLANADTYRFNATFDGNGYTISNGQMMFDAMGFGCSTVTTNNVYGGINGVAFNTGLFGSIGMKGTVKNVAFKNFSRQSYTDAGYESSTNSANATTVTWQFDRVTTTLETPTMGVNTCNVYPDRINGTSLFCNVLGTLENVYVQASYKPQVGTKFGASGIQGYIAFSCGGEQTEVVNDKTVTVSAKLTNCYFEIDSAVESGRMYAYRVYAQKVMTCSNVIIAGCASDTGVTKDGTMNGSVSMYATTEELKTAIQNGSVSMGSAWTVDENGLFALNIR